MAAESRLAQLRAFVARLSPRREWMLEEARARMVDVETGFPAETMRPLDTERHARRKPRRRVRSTPEAVKRRAPARAVVDKHRDPPPPELPDSDDKPPAPVADTSPAPFVLELAGDPFVGGGDALVDTGELLWLEDSPTVAATPVRGRRTIPRPCRSGDEACAADRSDGAVEHEDLGGGVRLGVVGAHERHHRALGEALDGLDQTRSHRLLKGPADLQDLSLLARLHEGLLGVGHAVVQQHDDQLAVDRGASLRRSPAGVV